MAGKYRVERVLGVGDVGVLETGASYMVMEYLEGCTLAAWLAERGPLAIETATEFVLQACEAVAEAHSSGSCTATSSPRICFCVERPDAITSIKVLDFGISKVTGGGGIDARARDDQERDRARVAPLHVAGADGIGPGRRAPRLN